MRPIGLFQNILTVCTGNICRSPAAQYLLARRLEKSDWRGQVQSSGIGALVGQPADATTQAMMIAQGIDLGEHRARQTTALQLREASLVLVMENHHREAVLDIFPAARGKTFLLGHWSDGEIPDPYRRGEAAHAEAIRRIDVAVAAWLPRMGVPAKA